MLNTTIFLIFRFLLFQERVDSFQTFHYFQLQIKYRKSGCKPDDRYRCRTFDNPIEGEGEETKRKYDDIEFDGEGEDRKEDYKDYTEGKYDCSKWYCLTCCQIICEDIFTTLIVVSV